MHIASANLVCLIYAAVPNRGVRTQVPSIRDREFKTWDGFMTFFEAFQKNHLLVYRVRDSLSATAYNNRRKMEARKNPGGTAPFLLPEEFDLAYASYKCTLGCGQRSRASGKRRARVPRFWGCNASVRLAVVQVQDGEHPRWAIRVKKEVRFDCRRP